MPTVHRIRRARRPQIDELFALVPIAAARQVVAGTSRWLCVPLPERYATRLVSKPAAATRTLTCSVRKSAAPATRGATCCTSSCVTGWPAA